MKRAAAITGIGVRATGETISRVLVNGSGVHNGDREFFIIAFLSVHFYLVIREAVSLTTQREVIMAKSIVPQTVIRIAIWVETSDDSGFFKGVNRATHAEVFVMPFVWRSR